MLTAVLGTCAVLCVAYGIVLLFYAGLGNLWLWACLAVVFGGLAWGTHYYLGHRRLVPLWIPVGVVTFCLACLAILIVIESMIFLGAAGSGVKGLDYVIVLGAKVNPDGSVSHSLKRRLDKAIEYAQENPDTVFVVSGGQGPDEPMTEAEAMRDYLVYNGVSADNILLEPHSTSTVENIAYSRLVIEEDKAAKKQQEKKPEQSSFYHRYYAKVQERSNQVGILTNDFHVYRAKMIARKWGIQNPVGIAASSDPVLFVHSCVREALAVFKDRLMGNM